MTPRAEAGLARVRAAMEHVERAQHELERAQCDLSSVIGYVREFYRIARLTSHVRTEWYRLEAKLRKPGRKNTGELDRDPAAGEFPHAGCGGAS